MKVFRKAKGVAWDRVSDLQKIMDSRGSDRSQMCLGKAAHTRQKAVSHLSLHDVFGAFSSSLLIVVLISLAVFVSTPTDASPSSPLTGVPTYPLL